MSPKLLGFADTHLIGHTTGANRLWRNDFTDALHQIRDIAYQEAPDVILFGGDAYNKWPGPRERTIFAKFLMELHHNVAPVVGAAGNHGRKRDGTPLDDVLVLDPSLMIATTAPQLFGAGNVDVIAVPWMTLSHLSLHREGAGREELVAAATEIIDTLIQHLLRRTRADSFKVLLAHCSVAGAVYSDVSGFTALQSLDPVWSPDMFRGFDAGLLGHVHKRQIVENTPCPVVYPGSTVIKDFGERLDTKGVAIFEDGNWRFVDLDTRPFVQLELSAEEYRAYDWSSVPSGAALKVIVQADEEPLPELPPGAWLHATFVLTGSTRERQPRMGEGDLTSLPPLEALERYFRAIGITPQRIKALMPSAKDIVTQVQQT